MLLMSTRVKEENRPLKESLLFHRIYEWNAFNSGHLHVLAVQWLSL